MTRAKWVYFWASMALAGYGLIIAMQHSGPAREWRIGLSLFLIAIVNLVRLIDQRKAKE